ncbi:uncharacterized protein LOC113757660 [Coffea eugenioides]|uniref:uncharacterized protein LOC113757660 n=1 Tax=Coffea eugenioides TaxID=49369 RepID=UPI000F615D3C|nr:uncharacterized protein LOC113757660 [Coffea eugenioides]
MVHIIITLASSSSMADHSSKSSATAQPPPTTNGRPPLPSPTSYHYSSSRPTPPAPIHPNQPHNAGRTRPRNCISHCLLSTAVTIGLIILLYISIASIVLDHDFPKFRVDSLTVSNFNLSSTIPPLLSGNFDSQITAWNPNKKVTLSYSHLEAEFYLGSYPISGTTLPPFILSGKNETSITLNFTTVRAFVDWGESDENLDFNLKICMKEHYKGGFWGWGQGDWLVFSCPDLSVMVNTLPNGSTPGGAWSLTGGARHCEFF